MDATDFYLKGKLSTEELKESVSTYTAEFVDLISGRILPQLNHLIRTMDAVAPCKQFQLAVQDLESIAIHMASYTLKGPLPRMDDIPLDDSEEEDDFSFDDGEDELEFADDEDSKTDEEE